MPTYKYHVKKSFFVESFVPVAVSKHPGVLIAVIFWKNHSETSAQTKLSDGVGKLFLFSSRTSCLLRGSI